MSVQLGPFKRPPRRHQLEALERSADAEYYALWMEQRTGKSQVALDTAAHQYRKRNIDSLLIVAPNGVHVAWVRDEVPAALPDDVDARCLTWLTSRAHTKRFQAEVEEWFGHLGRGLLLASLSIDSLLTEPAQVFLRRLLRHRVMAVLDESSDISTESAKRSRVAHAVGRRAVVRRILDGTPVAKGPLGLYSQCKFLSPDALGFRSYHAFKARYAISEVRDRGPLTRRCDRCHGGGALVDGAECPRCRGRRVVSALTYQAVVDYQRLDDLKERLDRFGFRVTRAQCADLPPKVYQQVYVELAPEQLRLYREMRDQFEVELRGTTVTAPLVLTRYLRLQQIASNVLPRSEEVAPCPACAGRDPTCDRCDGAGAVLRPFAATFQAIVEPARDPRLRALRAELERASDGATVVWARFRPDYAAIAGLCREMGLPCVEYHGGVSVEDRELARARFQGGDAQVFVGNARAGGRGLDLSRADRTVYYSHSWSLLQRLQSEDRAQSLAKTDSVLYQDLIALGTVDERIVAALRSGRSLSDAITGDPTGAWI